MPRPKKSSGAATGIPKFRNDAEETAWWDAHPELLAKALKHAGKKAAARPATQIITIRLPVEDLAIARRLAKQRGLGYQTVIKTLLHAALIRQTEGDGPEWLTCSHRRNAATACPKFGGKTPSPSE